MSNARAEQIQAALPADCKLSDRQMRELGRMLENGAAEAQAGSSDAALTRELAASCLPLAAQAARNIGNWGHQDLETLALVLQEKCGEVAKALLQHTHEGMPLDDMRVEATHAGAVCLQILEILRGVES
jgi:hypothetical protein